MCGIFGFSGDFDRLLLPEVAATIAHRGPDDHGIYTNSDANIALLHTRLSIIDLSPLGHQPMHSPSDDVVIIFNGEIYNFRELRKGLEQKGYIFNGHSDTEVILNLYLDMGLEMTSLLNGIFSIAIFDSRTADIFLIRDALGIKPLYYCETPKGVVFSSEIKTFNRFFDNKATIDHEAINRYLTYLYCPGNQTALSQVKKLEPGHIIRLNNGAIQGHWRWNEAPEPAKVERIDNKKEAILSVHDGLRMAVHRQMIADVPVGAFLSGGLDSSAIVAFAKEVNPDLRCFTIEPDGGVDRNDHDDLPYAIKVAKHLDVKLDVVKADASSLANDLKKMIWHLDEPLADPAALNVLHISKLARENGIKVLLSGAGGDDLFTGYRRHLALNYEKLWGWLPSATLQFFDDFSQNLDQDSVVGSKLSRLFLDANAIGDRKITKYFAWSRQNKLLALYSDEMKASILGSCADQPLVDYLSKLRATTSPIDKMLSLEQRFFLSDHNLNYTDKMSMAVGVEVRVPFLDQDLVEIASRVPSKYKQNGMVGKWVLKKAMEPYLPHEIIYRPKAGFGAPLRRWIKKDLRELVSSVLTDKSIAERGLFSPLAVNKLIQDNDLGICDGAHTIFSILCIEIWCQLFIDGKKFTA